MGIFSKNEADKKTAEVVAGTNTAGAETKVAPVVAPVAPPKEEGGAILIIRDGNTTKCSKKRLQGLLNAGWAEVKE